MDIDQPPNPTHNPPLQEITPSQQTDGVVDDLRKRETEVDGDDQRKKKKQITDDDSVDRKKIDPVPIFLFEKKLDSVDAEPSLNRLVIGSCRAVMMRAVATAKMKNCDHVRVTTTDPKGVEYQLRFARYSDRMYVFGDEWGGIVAAHGLREGDMVAGWGNVVGDDQIRMRLDITKTARESKPIMLFGKKLESADTNTSLNRLEVDYCWEVMKTTLGRVSNEKKCDHVKVFVEVDSSEYELEFRRYCGGKYVLCKWGAIVYENRLKKGDSVLGWGNLLGDDQFRCMLRIIRDPNSKECYIP